MNDNHLIAAASGVLRAWMAFAAAAPRRVFAALGVLCIVAGALAASLLSVDSDGSKMLNESLSFQQRSNEIKAAFPDVKNTIAIVVRAPTLDAADAAVEALAANLRARSDAFESVFAPAVDPFFLANGFLYGDVSAVEDRLVALSSASNLIARLRASPTLDTFLQVINEARALSERAAVDTDALDALYNEAAAVFNAHANGDRRAFGWATALNPDQAGGPVVRVVSVRPKLDFARLQPAKTALEAADAVIAALPPEIVDQVEIGVTGDVALRADELSSVTGNLTISLILSLIAVAALLRIAFRSSARALLAFATLLTTLVLTTGVAALIANPLNLVSIAFVVLMVGLGIDYAIHMLLHVEEVTRRGHPPTAALERTGFALGPPLILSALTTSLAFLAFATTNFVGMAQLGLVGGVGVLIAFAVAATLVPAAVAIWPQLAAGGDVAVADDNQRTQKTSPLFGQSVRRWAPGAALGVGLVALLAAPSVRFDADPMSLRNPDSPSVTAFDWLAQSQTATPFRQSLIADSREDATATAERLSALPQVTSVFWLGDFIPTDQDEKLTLLDIAYPSILHAVEGEPRTLTEAQTTATMLASELAGDRPAANAFSAALKAFEDVRGVDTAALEEDLYRYFPAFLRRISGILEADFVSIDTLPPPLVARYQTEDGRLLVEATPRDDLRDPAALEAFVDAIADVEPRAAGGPFQIASAGDTVAGAMAQATALALMTTALLSWLILRSVTQVLAIIAPLALAGAMIAAASVMLDIPFNYANVIVLPLMIGLGVDSGVHLAMRGVAEGAEGDVFATSTPRAVVFSALTTVAAFGTLALSDHRGTASMGAMLAIGLAASLFAVLSTTPTLIKWANSSKAPTTTL